MGLRSLYDLAVSPRFPITWASARLRDAYMEMLAGGVGGPRQGFPCSLLPGLRVCL